MIVHMEQLQLRGLNYFLIFLLKSKHEYLPWRYSVRSTINLRRRPIHTSIRVEPHSKCSRCLFPEYTQRKLFNRSKMPPAQLFMGRIDWSKMTPDSHPTHLNDTSSKDEVCNCRKSSCSTLTSAEVVYHIQEIRGSLHRNISGQQDLKINKDPTRKHFEANCPTIQA